MPSYQQNISPVIEHKDNSYYLVEIIVLTGIVALSFKNFLLFHTIVETFSVFIACSIFVVAWNTRKITSNNYLLFLGITYLFVGLLDFTHTLSYKGMNIFTGHGTNLPTQLWIGARYIESISLVIAPIFLTRRLNFVLISSIYFIICAFFLSSLFVYPLFPDCFIDGHGLTMFKKSSEYIISFILLTASIILYLQRDNLKESIFKLIITSLALTIISEIAFTFYVSVYGISNLIGHLFKAASFYLIYKAVIAETLTNPYNTLFHNLADSELKFRTLFDSMNEGVCLHEIIYDQSGRGIDYRILDANPSFEAITGINKQRATNNKTSRLYGANIHPYLDIARKVATTGQPSSFEAYFAPIEKHLHVSIFSPGAGYLATVFSDITELKQTERELQRSAEKIKMFAYSVAHDLKNPAIAINGLAKLLNKKYGEVLTDRGKRSCEQILQSSNQIVSLTDKVNTYIATKENPLVIEQVSLKEMIKVIFDEFSFQLKTRSIVWQEAADLPGAINADRIALLRILRNLVDNSLKYGGDGLSVIKVGHEETSDSHIISIADNGIGLAQEDEQNVFGIFKRKVSSRDINGAGLGLAIVKEIAELHKGQVWIKADPNRGITFYVSLSKSLEAMTAH